jgi:hypothetical protein
MIQELKAERAELLRGTPAVTFVAKPKVKVSLNDLLCQEANPQQEGALLQAELAGRRVVVQELYKYYSWTPDGDGTKFEKLTMSGENFVKFCQDAKLLSQHGGFTAQWALNVFVASCLQRYRSRGKNAGKATPVAGRYLKLNEFNEALVRLGYARYPEAFSLSGKLVAVMDEYILPFSKHKGSQVSSWFQEVCAREALAFA